MERQRRRAEVILSISSILSYRSGLTDVANLIVHILSTPLHSAPQFAYLTL